jgi:hypothetical protein
VADDSSSPANTSSHEPVATDTQPVAQSHESAQSTADVKASPSEAPKGETKETLLEAVMKAVKPSEDGDDKPSAEKSPTSERAGSSGPDGAEGDKGPDLSKDPTPEELAAYKHGTRQRIERLIGERNHFRADAQVTQTLRDFLVGNDIAREDFQLTLDLAAAMRRGDFRAFLEGVGPYVELATQALGLTLPPDLQNEVQVGRLTPDMASHISRERYARALAEQRATRATQVMTDQTNYQQQTHFAHSVEQTVAQWEQGIRQTDPDYGRKEETVRNFLWAVVREQGPPRSPEHAVQIATEAYNRANNVFRQAAPAPRATRAVPSSTNRSAAPGARSEPNSLMEAAMLGLERARRA